MSQPSIRFKSLTFSDGTSISLGLEDVVVLVGPNNGGKSLALRELASHLGGRFAGTVISSVELKILGAVEDLQPLLNKHLKLMETGQLQYHGIINFACHSLSDFWPNNTGPLAALFSKRMGTESRIQDSNPTGAMSVLDVAPTHPIHHMFLDDSVEERISGYFRRAFGKDLILFRGGGGHWPLVVGGRPELLPSEDRVSRSYVQRLRECTIPLDKQGDGMRSFAAVLIHLLASDAPSVLMVDEPEAFLHPPQARLIGEIIVRERLPHTQLFVATHSLEVLQGILSAARSGLHVLRIQRDGTVNRVKELDKERAAQISNDPLMNFTSVLAGVFHERVIVCESDADCMFYRAVLELGGLGLSQAPDALFLNAGGKHRMASIAAALHDLGVKIEVVADIDIFDDETVLEKLVVALGGEWSQIGPLAVQFKKVIEYRKGILDASEVKKDISEVLGRAPQSGDFPKPLRREIERIFRKASPWERLKEDGKAAIPAGDPTNEYETLEKLLQGCGLWVVPVGELEGFCKSEGNKGPTWVQAVMKKYDLASDPKLASVREFVRQVWKHRA